MLAAALRSFDWSWLRLSKADVRRACLAGAAWGIALSGGLAALSAWQCGGVCLPELAVNTGLAVAAGMLAIGPLAAYGGRR